MPAPARKRRPILLAAVAETAAKVVARRTAGGVVLMHLGGSTTRDALPAMIAGLRAASHNPTTVTALYR